MAAERIEIEVLAAGLQDLETNTHFLAVLFFDVLFDSERMYDVAVVVSPWGSASFIRQHNNALAINGCASLQILRLKRMAFQIHYSCDQLRKLQ